MVIGIRTLTSIDGVIGLNGYVYLEDNNGNQLTWQSLEDAKQYIENCGEDSDSDYLEYYTLKEEDAYIRT